MPQYVNFADYRMNLGPLSVDLAVSQNRCPLGITVKDVDTSRYALSVLIWHWRLLYSDCADALANGDMSGLGLGGKVMAGIKGWFGAGGGGS